MGAGRDWGQEEKGTTPGIALQAMQEKKALSSRWDPDSLRPALSLGGQATAGERSPGRSLCLTHKAQLPSCMLLLPLPSVVSLSR